MIILPFHPIFNALLASMSGYGVIAQLVERMLSMHEALGSTPSNSTFFREERGENLQEMLSKRGRLVFVENFDSY